MCVSGIPGSGKTTIARSLAEYYEVPLIHSSRIAKEACPGDWIELGKMAPEPCTTLAVERVLEENHQWVLDGFPRSQQQLRSPYVRHEAIVYLDVSVKVAMNRVVSRGRALPKIEIGRIMDQRAILAPVRQQAAVIIPTTFRDPQEVLQAVIRWYEDNIHPSELGSNAR